jgi:hypothetical protein
MKKLNKLFLALLLAAFIMPAFQSCKKGPNDPAISLKSRTSRLSGTWSLTKGSEMNVSGTSTTTTTYSTGSFTVVSGSSSYTGTYTWEWVIDKAGTYTMTRTRTITGASDTYKDEGHWFWADGNKDDNIKNKQMVCMRSEKRTYTDASGTDIFNETFGSLTTYMVDKLSTKETVLKRAYSYSSTSTSSDTEEYTLTKK